MGELRHGPAPRRRPVRTSMLAALSAGVLVLSLATPDAAFARPSQGDSHKVWSPFPLPTTKSVAGHPATGKPGAARSAMPATRAAHAAKWPGAHTVDIAVPDAPTAVPGTGLTLRTGTPTHVSVAVADHAKALAAGVDGVLMSLSAASPTPLAVGLDSAALAGAYGGDYAASLHLVKLPACALTTPSAAGCRTQTPLAATSAVSVSATPMLVATTAAASSPNGSYSATSLKSSDTWSAGGNSGALTYSVPVKVPPALGGATPNVALNYDSGSVDGESVNANSQASWIGDGWGYNPGFIERSFQSCADAGQHTGDLCWKNDNATLAGGSHAGGLVRNDANGVWKLATDDGTTVEEKTLPSTFPSNGTADRTYWQITMPDGTKYFYGAGHLPPSAGGTGADPASNAAFTEPVYATAAGQPCYNSAGFSSSWCQQGYRWNLDYVVDPHGNTTVYTYEQETGNYTRGYDGLAAGTVTSYVRAGNLRKIGYGWRTGDVATGTAKPAAEVDFDVVERCMGDPGGCQPGGLNGSTAGYWRDTPFYLNCPATGTCTQYSPTFWSTRMLHAITTQVTVGGTPRPVDTYTLAHSWPEPGDGYPASLWLDSVQHTGYAADGVTGQAEPAISFTGKQMANRVPGRTANGQTLPSMIHYRLQTITDELGAKVTVAYSDPTCSQSAPVNLPASADANTMLCYPVNWTPVGGAKITDWFTKYVVKSVTVNDSITATASPARVTTYEYVGTPAWHDNDSEFVKNEDRTWDQWRGYQKVITRTGAAPDPVTKSQVTYLRGLDGDLSATGTTRSVTVTDSQGAAYRDTDALAGTVLETETFDSDGGHVVSDVVSTPHVSSPLATHVRPTPLPAQTSVQTDTTKTVTRDLLAGGTWRTHEVDYTYDAAHGDRLTATDDKGDGSASSPETCSLVKYATSANPNLLTYPYERLTVAGGCATTPGPTTTLGDAVTLYDGNTAAGSLDNAAYAGGQPVADVTGTQILASYNGSTPSYVNTATATFDAYGRTLTATDPNADPAHPAAGITRTVYTPATGALPTQLVSVNPKGFVTTTTVDPGRSAPTEITDPNGRLTDLRYDPLGRLTQVWLPGRAMSAFPDSPNQKYSYGLGGGVPAYTLTQTLRENGGYASAYAILDGFGEVRQSQTDTLNGTAGRLITDNYYDSHGWAAKTHTTYFNKDAGPTSTLQITDDDAVPGSAATTYDGLGRAVRATIYQFAVVQTSTTTAYPGAGRVDVTPPAGTAPTSTFTDVRGHTTELWRYTGPAATGVRTDADVLAYTYDAAGRQTAILDPNGDNWRFQYDLRGRRTVSHDPSAGDTTTAYDDDNRVLSTKDADGIYNTFTYDVLGRKLTQFTGSATPGTGTQVAAWTYDTGMSGAKGQPVSSTAYHNGFAYTTTVSGYAATMAGAYTPTGSKIVIPAGDGNTGIDGTYTTAQTFTPNIGLPAVTTLPAAGGLAQEDVTSAYDVPGELVSVGSSVSAVTDVAYDPLGKPIRTTLGTKPNQAAVTYAYDAASGRLLTQTFNEESQSAALDTVDTYYNPAGQITAVRDARSTGGTDLQCFGYDYAGRVTTAWTDTGTVTSAGTQFLPNTGACAHAAPTSATAASQIGGPTPYWSTYGYKSNGDRTADTIHDITGVTSKDVKHAYAYPAASNLLQSVTTTGPPGTSTDTYTYNASGGTKNRTKGSQSFGYDSTGRVATATTGSAASSYVYDAGGSLLIQHDPGENVLYLGSQEVHYNTATATASGIRHIAGPGGAQSIESSDGAVTFTFADPHGTSTVDVDGHTQAVARRTFDPYGNARGPDQGSYALGTWPDERTFLNKPTDAASGLTLIGPRQYDSLLGRFLQPDPVLETADLDQIGGFAYGADDPVNRSDPSGLRTEDKWYGPSEIYLGGGPDQPRQGHTRDPDYHPVNNGDPDSDPAPPPAPTSSGTVAVPGSGMAYPADAHGYDQLLPYPHLDQAAVDALPVLGDDCDPPAFGECGTVINAGWTTFVDYSTTIGQAGSIPPNTTPGPVELSVTDVQSVVKTKSWGVSATFTKFVTFNGNYSSNSSSSSSSTTAQKLLLAQPQANVPYTQYFTVVPIIQVRKVLRKTRSFWWMKAKTYVDVQTQVTGYTQLPYQLPYPILDPSRLP